MNKFIDHIELLAPAGSYEALHAAINAGADAVYFGVCGFNMRANASQPFSLDDLSEIVRISHEAGIKCYLALNTLVYDKNLDEMKMLIDASKNHGVDAIISFDFSAIQYARKIGVEVHISTQHSISNMEAVKFFSQYADRIVLARELTLEQIHYINEQIKDQNVRGPNGKLVEVEVFIHGAMCVAVSGRCGMSLYLFGTSANCGECTQPCRRSYTVTDKSTGKQLDIDNEYVMSTQDLCTIGMLDEIVQSGVVSLKVEGRGRSPEYVDEVIRCYREALVSIKDGTYSSEKIQLWNTRLGTVFNRGMSEGFYRGLAYNYWSTGANSKASKIKQFIGTVEHYYPKIHVAEVRVRAGEIQEGEQGLILGPTTGVVRVVLDHLRVNDVLSTKASPKDLLTFVVNDKVRKGDKLYVLRQRSE
jgi:U32 family peptidase